jgi:hypothetical protein
MSRRPWDPDCGLDIATTSIRDAALLSAISHYGYRVVRHHDGTHYLHESYYADDDSILGIARKPAEPCADTLTELAVVLEDMQDALLEPVLDYADYIERRANGW